VFNGRAARLVEVSRDNLINEPKLQIRSTTYVSRVGFVSSLQTILLCLSEMEKNTLNFMSHRKNQPPQMKKALLFIRNPFCRFYDRVYDGSRCTKKKKQPTISYLSFVRSPRRARLHLGKNDRNRVSRKRGGDRLKNPHPFGPVN
jgi:hypothetical protein